MAADAMTGQGEALGMAVYDGAGRVILEREHDVVSELAGALTGVYQRDELDDLRSAGRAGANMRARSCRTPSIGFPSRSSTSLLRSQSKQPDSDLDIAPNDSPTPSSSQRPPSLPPTAL